MKKRMCILAGIILIVSVLSIRISASAETAQALPSKNRIVLKTEGGPTEVKNVTVYTIDDKNYFKLRDVTMLIHFSVGWNASIREIKLNLSENYNNSVDLRDGVLEKMMAVPMEQNILVNGDSVTLSGYNINGYNYFSVRDLAEIADFECTWNKENNTVSLSKGFNEEISQEERNNLDELVKEHIEDERKQKIIEENNVRYVAKSKNYEEIEKYILSHINPEFNLDDFVIEEYSLLGDVVIDTTKAGSDSNQLPINMLDIRYYVGEYRSSFGYQVSIIHGYAKLIDYVGEWNNDFHLDEIKFPTISDEELERKAAAYYSGQKITGYSIVRLFDMETLEFEAAVSVSFITKGGYHVSDVHTFTL